MNGKVGPLPDRTNLSFNFFCIRPPLELLPILGPLERYVTPTLDTALLCSSRAGSDLGRTLDWFEEISQSHHGWVSILLILTTNQRQN